MAECSAVMPEVAALSAKLERLFAVSPLSLTVLDMMADRMLYNHEPRSAGGLGMS